MPLAFPISPPAPLINLPTSVFFSNNHFFINMLFKYTSVYTFVYFLTSQGSASPINQHLRLYARGSGSSRLTSSIITNVKFEPPETNIVTSQPVSLGTGISGKNSRQLVQPSTAAVKINQVTDSDDNKPASSRSTYLSSGSAVVEEINEVESLHRRVNANDNVKRELGGRVF